MPSDWDPVEVEPSPNRSRQLPDGRLMAESRITVSKEMMEQMWQGYRCAACLEDLTDLGAFPVECPLCHFPVRAAQRQQLERDFVGEIEEMEREGWVEREEEYLSRRFFEPKPQIHVRRQI